jgi:hypothetical protein
MLNEFLTKTYYYYYIIIIITLFGREPLQRADVFLGVLWRVT